VHVLLQLDFIPRQAAKEALSAQGIELLAYVPDYAWIASVPAGDAAAALDAPGVVWLGALRAEDKLDPAIRAERWGPFNLAPDGTAAVHVVLHEDESLATGRALVQRHGGQVAGEVQGIRTLVVEMPKSAIGGLAAEDAIQWIEAVGPPWRGANDGVRGQIRVNAVNDAPYSLLGAGVDVLVYDSGQVGDHVDFGSRLTHGDGDAFSSHSTHVAGIIGGSGANSINEGGSPLQWRGMAPVVDLISYGTGYAGSGFLFYENVPDIESDWAAAQNTYGADLGSAGLGSSIYANYPETGCHLMGRYGASAVLLDQIVRGDNTVVGIGDRYVATWSVGNERGWAATCGGRSYRLIAPPAAAKNPIHVGACNTNNTTQYAHTSWGPTEDGRIKPIVTAGGCQTTGDRGVTSTDDNPVNGYTTMCGTSMANAAVAGGVALMIEHYREIYNTSGTFWPSTARAILMQTASDEGRPGPDYAWGYGLVDIQAAVDLISRWAFRQAHVDDDGVDVYALVVPNDDPLRVSLAWDDHEATFNASPALINDLDLELVSPSGSIWRPWILDPDAPTSNATRGVNDVDNQEQVEVPSPEVGTWLVRVRGATVPQGPQAYSLACEGCRPLDVGVCQSRVDGTVALGRGQGLDEADGVRDRGAAARSIGGSTVVSAGEFWQRTLEREAAAEGAGGGDATAEVAAGLAALEAARQAGPEAVVALLDTLRGPALDATIDEIQEAQEVLRRSAPPGAEGGFISEREEQATLDAQRALEAANRTQAMAFVDDPAEGGMEGPAGPTTSGATAPEGTDRTVGSGCDYASLGAALVAAKAGDRLLIEGGVTFYENVTIDKSVTLEGGYAGCASGSSARTTIDGGGSERVLEILAGLDVTLKELIVTNGSTSAGGGGIRFAPGGGTGDLTLTRMEIRGNSAAWGGGLWVGADAAVNGSGVEIHNNTASLYGGGVRLYGGRATFEATDIHDNAAPRGGGVYATEQGGHSPVLNLPANGDIADNEALTGDGLGGGVYVRQGSVSLSGASDLYANHAIQGGGAYLVTATLTLQGDASEVGYNTSTDSGGGVFAQGSSVNLDEDAEIEYNEAGTGGLGLGGGAWLDDSTLFSDRASINGNTAENAGGGVYAANGSIVDMDLGGTFCPGARCSRLHNNVASAGYGGGVYLSGSDGWLDNTFVESNRGTLGGGVYAYQSTIHVDNSLFTRNSASNGSGDGARLFNDGILIGSGNTFAHNALGGTGAGRAIDIRDGELELSCSIIWGHVSSIGEVGHDVTYSDVQGGYVGEGNLNVDPLFVAPASSDYHLQVTSPVIDRCLDGGASDFDAERRPIVRETAASPYDMGADEVSGAMRVGLNGSPCGYATLQQAVNAAADGDTVQIAEGVYFENVDVVNKDIALAGGYDGTCTATGTEATRIEGSLGSGSTVDVFDGRVTLQDLEIAWGAGAGGGLNAGDGAMVTLDQTTIHDNHGTYGGGIYVATGGVVTLTNASNVVDNTASVHGGGARVWGTLVGSDTLSDLDFNCAPHGGGVSVAGGVLRLEGSDMEGNEAAGAEGRGGGIYAQGGGSVALLGNAWVYRGAAYDGAGVYLDEAVLDLAAGVLGSNEATHDGGGAYVVNGSTLMAGIYAEIGRELYPNAARNGGGVYVDGSTVECSARMGYNSARERGGGIAALGSSRVRIREGVLQHNTADGYGGGIYVEDSSVRVSHARLAHNTGERGGALFQTGSAAGDVRNTLIYSNTSTAGLGGGIRSQGGAITVTHATLAHNVNGAGYSQSNTEGFAVNSIAWGNEMGGFWVTSGDLAGTCSLDQSGNAGPSLDPLFVAPGAGEDYHLSAGSPAIDRCATGLPDDLDRAPRPVGAGYDAGAYEYGDWYVYLPLVVRGY
jgi:hypothetical protein